MIFEVFSLIYLKSIFYFFDAGFYVVQTVQLKGVI